MRMQPCQGDIKQPIFFTPHAPLGVVNALLHVGAPTHVAISLFYGLLWVLDFRKSISQQLGKF